ncbi:MAG: TIGR00269 family protein [Candidatus Aenigmarchaeota archaeon]|nr:TIGR00269 family protein [Candidatus Aenigmarchaeota archaeon]
MITCYKCGNRAVIYRKYEGRAWCKKHFSEQLESKVKKTIRDEKLIEKNDKICVALSGGKDSSLTLYLLHKFFGKRPDIEIFALTVDEGISGYRKESIKIAEKLCKKLGVEHHVVSFKEEFGKTLDEIVEKKKARACTYCGVLRRYLLNKKSREFGATKLAVGHNLDDEIQSIFINYLKGDINRLIRLGAKPAIISKKEFVVRIKPLRNIPEKETTLYCLLNGIQVHRSVCPYSHDSVRFDVRNFLNQMEEKYPGTKYNVIKFYDTLKPALVKHFKDKGGKVRICPRCGEPTSRDICKTCELLDSIKD